MKKIITFVLIIVIISTIANLKSYAVTLPELGITSYHYSTGDKIVNEDIKNVEVGKELQLYAIKKYGNDVYDPDNPDSLGWYVSQADLEGVVWTSSNESIAKVDNTGKVTCVSNGKATIIATYNGKNANYEINVKEPDFTGFWITDKDLIPQPAFVLNKERPFIIHAYNIPYSEKDNIKITIDNENIVKITDVKFENLNNESGIFTIFVNAKFLSLGEFTITVTINYNGKSYSDSYTNQVVESGYYLLLSSKEYTQLPQNIETGKKLQLNATLGYVGSTLLEDVTTKGVDWSSNNENVATIDSSGLLTAKTEGKTIITAKYSGTDGIVTTNYEINVIDSTKSPNNQDPTIVKKDLPNTGKNIVMISAGIALIVVFSIVMYKKSKEI